MVLGNIYVLIIFPTSVASQMSLLTPVPSLIQPHCWWKVTLKFTDSLTAFIPVLTLKYLMGNKPPTKPEFPQSDLNIYLLPYFFGYKTEIFSFQNNPKDLDLSSKKDLDLWDCLGRLKWYYCINS